jgi:hypothetical protein
MVIFACFVSMKCVGQTEDFDKFLIKFSNDSIFQVSRVEFPLKYVFLDDDTFETDSSMINKVDYRFNRFHYTLLECSEAYPVFYDNFKRELRDTGERVFRWKGFTGMDERYYFKRKNNKWFLVRVEHVGT